MQSCGIRLAAPAHGDTLHHPGAIHVSQSSSSLYHDLLVSFLRLLPGCLPPRLLGSPYGLPALWLTPESLGIPVYRSPFVLTSGSLFIRINHSRYYLLYVLLNILSIPKLPLLRVTRAQLFEFTCLLKALSSARPPICMGGSKV